MFPKCAKSTNGGMMCGSGGAGLRVKKSVLDLAEAGAVDREMWC